MSEREPESAADRVRGLFRTLDRDERRQRRKGWIGRLFAAAMILAVGAPLVLVGAWRFIDPPFTWLMVERAFSGESLNRRPVSIERISPHLVRAVIAAEDARFCAHDGFDIEAIQRALKTNAEGKRVRGGSTISQQTAKNVFLWAERSWVRKGLEAYFTVLIEAFWPKRRIMEAYLNAAEWGDGRFGAQAAARELFGKEAKDLTPREAARLAAVLPSPNKWSADKPGPYVRRRTETILARMAAVRRDGLDACVWGDAPPAAAPEPKPTREKPAPRGDDRTEAPPPALEALPPLEPPPALGPEADPAADVPQIEGIEPAREEPAAPSAPAATEEEPAPAPAPAPDPEF